VAPQQAEGSGSSAPAAALLVPWDDGSCEALTINANTNESPVLGSRYSYAYARTETAISFSRRLYLFRDGYIFFETAISFSRRLYLFLNGYVFLLTLISFGYRLDASQPAPPVPTRGTQSVFRRRSDGILGV
jgi:hypothetical protein